MSTLVVVHCYAGDADQVRSMLPVWTQHGHPVLVLSPEDAPVEIDHPLVTNASAGLRGWKGPQTISRQLAHWKLAVEHGSDWLLLHDSDSVTLSEQVPEYLYRDAGIFWSNVLCHEEVHQDDDRPNFNPPYFCSREQLERLIAAAEQLNAEDPFIDSYGFDIGQAIDGFYTHLILNVLKHERWGNFPDGATTWPPQHADLERDARRGATMIHGVKTAEQLMRLLLAHQEFKEAAFSEA